MNVWQLFTEPEAVTGAGVEKLKFYGGIASKTRVKTVDNKE